MPKKFFGRAVLVAFLSVALARPARADSLENAAIAVVVGIVIVTATVAVVVAVLVLRHKHREVQITGCVGPGAKGMRLKDERDKRIYDLSGDTAGIKVGDRVSLEGKRTHSGTSLVFETQRVARDFGACRP
jgi:hypothetical protein